MKTATTAKKSLGKWIDDLADSVGKFVCLETHEGVRREGKITGFRSTHIVFNRVRQEIVTEIEINGDPADCVQIQSISTIEVT